MCSGGVRECAKWRGEAMSCGNARTCCVRYAMWRCDGVYCVEV